MADKLRRIAQKLKDKVHLPNFTGRDKVDQIITRYVPATRVSEIAERIKNETVAKRVRDIVTRYEKFTGVEEIMALQNTVVDAQERFMAAQERRRELGRQVTDVEMKLKELHSEMQNTMKGDDKYLHLCTEEHKFIVQERALRALFGDAEREERELFATMSAAVKLGHERERAHAERNKYWYIVASIFGTVLGIAGSSINNHLKMSEFRDMMEQQMARSASVLYTIAGGGSASRADISEAMKAEFAYQDNLAKNLELMQTNLNNLVDKQETLIDNDEDPPLEIEIDTDSSDPPIIEEKSHPIVADFTIIPAIDSPTSEEKSDPIVADFTIIPAIDSPTSEEKSDPIVADFTIIPAIDSPTSEEKSDPIVADFTIIPAIDSPTSEEKSDPIVADFTIISAIDPPIIEEKSDPIVADFTIISKDSLEENQHLQHRERTVDTQLRDLTRAIVNASQSSLKSDAEITKALSAVHQDLEDVDQTKENDKNKVLLEPNQILTGIGVIMAMAIILGNFIGRVS